MPYFFLVVTPLLSQAHSLFRVTWSIVDIFSLALNLLYPNTGIFVLLNFEDPNCRDSFLSSFAQCSGHRHYFQKTLLND